MYLSAISPYLVNFGCGQSRTPVSDGQSRTPVPTILDYPNILMRTLVTRPLFDILIFPSARTRKYVRSLERSGCLDRMLPKDIL